MYLKLISLIVIVWLAGHPSFAQQTSDELLRLQKFKKYQKMENTGMTLTVIGTVLFVAGNVIRHNATVVLLDGTTGNPEVGLVCTLLGVGGLGSGVPLWITGAKNRKKYSSTPGQVTVGLNANLRQQGLTLSYRF